MIPFGTLPDGTPAELHILHNDALHVAITNFGARMVSVMAPDRNGVPADVLLGFDDGPTYASAGGSFGAVLGRCANRIGGARFTLDGREYHLAANNGPNMLHGGAQGFGQRCWAVQDAGPAHLQLALTSPDGDAGFPGTLRATARYTLHGATLRLELGAQTDAPTMVNLSAHPYFNLSGSARHDILGHEVMVHAQHFLPVDAAQLPSGELRAVAGTPFDFRTPRTLAEGIFTADPQLRPGRGYDHCFVLDGPPGTLRPAAWVLHQGSGRTLEIRTTQPGLQLYSGNSLNGAVIGKGGIMLRQSAGLALEAQNFPDAPNRPEFPSAVLRPGAEYAQVIEYTFGLASLSSM